MSGLEEAIKKRLCKSEKGKTQICVSSNIRAKSMYVEHMRYTKSRTTNTKDVIIFRTCRTYYLVTTHMYIYIYVLIVSTIPIRCTHKAYSTLYCTLYIEPPPHLPLLIGKSMYKAIKTRYGKRFRDRDVYWDLIKNQSLLVHLLVGNDLKGIHLREGCVLRVW